MALMIDPPSGWKYGFPKPIPEDRRQDVIVWLVEEGYPKNLIDAFGEDFCCRYWEVPEEEKAIFKFNGGLGALLCSKCRVIMRTAKDFSEEELKGIRGELDYNLPPQYCETCKNDNV